MIRLNWGLTILLTLNVSCHQRESLPKLDELPTSIQYKTSLFPKIKTAKEDHQIIKWLIFLDRVDWSIHKNKIQKLFHLWESSENQEIKFWLALHFHQLGLLKRSRSNLIFAIEKGYYNFRSCFLMAMLHYNDGQNSKAIDWCNESLKLNRQYYPAYKLKSEILKQSDQPQRAINCLESFSSYVANNKEAQINLLKLYIDQSVLAKAEDQLGILKNEFGTLPELQLLQVDFLISANLLDSAQNILKSLINSENVKARKLAQERLLKSYKTNSQRDEIILLALDRIQTTESSSSDDLVFWFLEMGQAYESKWFYSSARNSYLQALEVQPENSKAIDHLDQVNRKIAYLRSLKPSKDSTENN